MSKQNLVIGVLTSLAMLVVGAGSASAYTISPQGPFEATGGMTFNLGAHEYAGPESIACGIAKISGSATSSTVSGSPTFSNCSVPPSSKFPQGQASLTLTQSITSVTGMTLTPTTASLSNLKLHFMFENGCYADIVGKLYFSNTKNAAGEVTGFTTPSYIQNLLKIENAGPPAGTYCPFFLSNGQPVTTEIKPLVLNHALNVR